MDVNTAGTWLKEFIFTHIMASLMAYVGIAFQKYATLAAIFSVIPHI